MGAAVVLFGWPPGHHRDQMGRAEINKLGGLESLIFCEAGLSLLMTEQQALLKPDVCTTAMPVVVRRLAVIVYGCRNQDGTTVCKCWLTTT